MASESIAHSASRHPFSLPPGSNYFFENNFLASRCMKGYTLPKHQNCKNVPVVQIRVDSNVVYLDLAMLVSTPLYNILQILVLHVVQRS